MRKYYSIKKQIVYAIVSIIAILAFWVVIVLTGMAILAFKDFEVVSEFFSEFAENPLILPFNVNDAFSSDMAFSIAIMFVFANPFARLLTLITEGNEDERMIDIYTYIMAVICVIFAYYTHILYISADTVVEFIVCIVAEFHARMLEKEKSHSLKDDLLIHISADVIRMLAVIYMAFLEGGTELALIFAISIPLVKALGKNLKYVAAIIKRIEKIIEYERESRRFSNPAAAFHTRVYDMIEAKIKSYEMYMKLFMDRINFPIKAYKLKLC